MIGRMHVRYCPECDQEFRPHVERCSDCGGPLEDHFEGLETSPGERAEGGPGLAPDETVALLHRSTASRLEPLAAALGRAAVPFRVDPRPGYGGFDLKVRPEDAPRAAQALAEALGPELLAEAGEAPEGREGHCPACEAPVPPQAAECPECGLGLGQAVPACGSCGEAVDPATGRCARCEPELL